MDAGERYIGGRQLQVLKGNSKVKFNLQSKSVIGPS